MGIPDHLTCLLRNLYAGQEATVRTVHGTTDWFQIRKSHFVEVPFIVEIKIYLGLNLKVRIFLKYICQGCILSPCLFNLYAEYIMQNAGLDETQAGIKIAPRNINNLRYADNTTLMAESKEELKNLLMNMKEENEKKLA